MRRFPRLASVKTTDIDIDGSSDVGPQLTRGGLSLNYAGSADALADPYAFPALGRVDGFPPTLIVVCEHDALRPSGEAFARQLDKAGVDVSLRLEQGADHGHINEPADPAARRTVESIASWIRWVAQSRRSSSCRS